MASCGLSACIDSTMCKHYSTTVCDEIKKHIRMDGRTDGWLTTA